MVTTDQTGIQNIKALVFGAVAVVILVVAGVGGARWWQQRNEPSQASAADCTLAQQIIDEAQNLPRDKAAVAKWQVDTGKLRRARMQDGYLGLQIAIYEGWAAYHATGQGAAPAKQKLDTMASTANSHCRKAKRTLVVPPIGS